MKNTNKMQKPLKSLKQVMLREISEDFGEETLRQSVKRRLDGAAIELFAKIHALEPHSLEEDKLVIMTSDAFNVLLDGIAHELDVLGYEEHDALNFKDKVLWRLK